MMKIDEALQTLESAGYICETSIYENEIRTLLDYFPTAKNIDIHVNRSIRSPLWKTLYGWECEFKLKGKRHWFTFGKGGCSFEPSLQAYITKYCKLESFNDYKELKKEYPEATLEDIRSIATMGESMEIREAQRILKENGLVMKEQLVNTRSIDNIIEELQKVKSKLCSLAAKVESIYRKIGIEDANYKLYSNREDNWYLVTELESGAVDYTIQGKQIEINYTAYGFGTKTCTYDKLEDTIKHIFRKR